VPPSWWIGPGKVARYRFRSALMFSTLRGTRERVETSKGRLALGGGTACLPATVAVPWHTELTNVLPRERLGRRFARHRERANAPRMGEPEK
jgi:hypothetical protein